MNSNRDINSIATLVGKSFDLVRKHLYIYVIAMVYLVLASIVISILGCFALPVGYISMIVSIVSSESTQGGFSAFFVGIMGMILIAVILTLMFVMGYIGGMSQMLIGLLVKGKASMSDFRIGVFRHGLNLVLGSLFISIMTLIPFYWGMRRLMKLYGIFDFATMQSGWNHHLRLAVSSAHGWIVLSTYAICAIILLLLGFWWIITISERRNFIYGYVKSVAFFARYPLSSLVVLVGCFAGLAIISLMFGELFKLMGSTADWGQMLGAYIFLPFMILILLQFYEPGLGRVKKVEQQNTSLINLSETRMN